MLKQINHSYSTYKDATPRPYLIAELENKYPNKKSKKLQFVCLIDSGADWNLLPPFVCDVLGHDLTAGDGPYIFGGVGEETINAYAHSNRVKFLDEKKKVFFEGEMKFYIAEKWDSDIGLLGHDEFFQTFPVFFDSPRNYFSLYL